MLSRISGTGCHFSPPTHKDTDGLKRLYGIDVIIDEPAAYYQATRKVLLFRQPC
jgi:hypothetical protein